MHQRPRALHLLRHRHAVEVGRSRMVRRRLTVNRKIKWESDSLGRLVKVTEQDASGTLNQVTNYTYDKANNLIRVDQGGQTRAFKRIK